jgi:cyclopropane fatty-acyl-phospholipid synthase-like methyltransferase
MINERGIWLSEEETNKHIYDSLLADALVDLFKDSKSVVDIGCGNGKYTMNFINHGVNCKGYDGSPLTPEISGGLCEVMDFSDQVSIGKFDLVLSLEVGEHIPAQYEQIFIDNISRAATKHIVLSWAIEGQGGDGHYNERNNDYVITEICKRGFEYEVTATELLRASSEVPWFKNTVMVFKKVIN